jgi:hypothetical protein
MSDKEEPGGIKKHPEAIVYISNLSEDVWPFISAMSDPAKRKTEIDENARLSDRDLFSLAGEDHVLFISPKQVSDEFLSYYRDLIGTKNIDVAVTTRHSGEICRDILKDPIIIEKIIAAANSSKRLTMIPYATSFQFLELVGYLRSLGITVSTPESPEEEDAWTVNFYGSKSGIRQLAQQSVAAEPDFRVPDGIICVSSIDASRIAAKKYIKEDGVVLKTNKGHSGVGILIFRPGDLPKEYHACQQKIFEALRQDSYWDLFPIIVEDFVVSGITIGGGFPNVEFLIHKNGRIEFLYYCSLRVTKDGVFKGVEINDDVIPEKQATQMMDTGFFIAEQYVAAGYRGYFDVDYVAGKNGKLYINESNVRRTGGTHVFHTAEELFGKDFTHTTHVLSNNSYPLSKVNIKTFHELIEQLHPVLYNKKTKEGVIICSENLLSIGQLMYIIFGKTRKRALEIESVMEELLSA